MERPESPWFTASDGCLHDTRKPEWWKHPVRRNYAWHHRSIATVADLKACLRAGEFAWPGGYRCYFLTSDGAALSFATVRAEWRIICDSTRRRMSDGWQIVALTCTSEDEELVIDDHSGEVIYDPAE